MRILKFIGAFAGTFLIIFLLVFGFNLDALYTLFDNSEDLQEGQEWVPKTTSLKGLTEYIGKHPDRTSVVSRSVTNPDTTINYGGNNPHTMGTLSNFFLIATYARLVESNEVDPSELIPVRAVDRYQLPFIDASKHDDAKSALQNDGAFTTDMQVSLDQLVQSAIIYNDLAISDFLFEKLGKEAIYNTLTKLELTATDYPLPFSGLYITLNPNLKDTTFDPHFKYLQGLTKEEFQDTVFANTEKYQKDQAFRKKVNTTFTNEKGLGINFTERRNALNLFPKSTAAELSQLMVQLDQNHLISTDVSKRIKDIMNWPYDEQGLNNDFKYYGAIYDNRLGLLNGIDYGASVYSQEPFGQAVFFDSLQVAFWFHMSSSLMHQDYQQRLMWDPALRTATLHEITANSVNLRP